MVPAGRLRLRRRARRSRRASEKPIGQHGRIVAQRVLHKRRTRKVEPKAELSIHAAWQTRVESVRRSNIPHYEK
ncbi:hypothetical protein [Burkholderia pseudomallei]|uniref:hypothetical protein n=1 Tax=Burkholderia pseudomallei TaxID=28450 RepID=UPI000A1A1FAA|nr:hypothetical protein [Burkholderia pseudomallei]ARK51647.1 hypothetical protein BOC35_30190 [Burkholderia pseudomallei]ARK87200.1 hypothetical protein BOC42_07250 [Burkholderia pseudomallei]ARL24642.1 hypothetical protein BOC47_00090 [Burkholderia pseudomallei]ARL31846.1 hypothetical protein BOC48_17330 [Burkholderia pseudomallei]ARL74594.1 hypothetical protein BOC54_03735 [Burkholderia pseudomallei]